MAAPPASVTSAGGDPGSTKARTTCSHSPGHKRQQHTGVVKCRGVEPSRAPRPWLEPIESYDPQFVHSCTAIRERILRDGAIPTKYKILTGMVTDAIAAHQDGVTELANLARAAGATEAEITEAVEVGYLYGGTAALVMGMKAFIRTDKLDRDTGSGS